MPKFEQVTPILCVRDVDASIAYYTEQLGFDDHWCWGEPSAFGAVRRDGFEIQFCKDGQGSPGDLDEHLDRRRRRALPGLPGPRGRHPPAAHQP